MELLFPSPYPCLLILLFYGLFPPPISVFMGPTEVPSQSPEAIKIPTAHYEFGANFMDPKVCKCQNQCILLNVYLTIKSLDVVHS